MSRLLVALAALAVLAVFMPPSDAADDVTILGEPFRSHGADVTSVDMSSDGKLALSTGEDKAIRLWDVETGAASGALEGHEAVVLFAFFYDGGKRIVSFDAGGELRFWDVKKRRTIGQIGDLGEVDTEAPSGLAIRHGAVSPDRKELTFPSPSRDEFLRVDLGRRQMIDPLTPGGEASCVAYTPDGKGIILGHQVAQVFGGRVTVWHRRKAKVVYTQGCPRPLRIAVAADSKSYVIASIVGLQVRGVGSGDVKRMFQMETRFDSGAHISGGRKLYLGGSTEEEILCWDLRTGGVAFTAYGHEFGVSGMALSPDGELLVTGGDDAAVRFWNAKTGARVHVSAGHRSAVDALAFSPDGDRILSGCQAGAAFLWDAEKGRAIHGLPVDDAPGSILGVAFLESGKLFSLDAGGEVRVYDPGSGDVVRKVALYEDAPPIASSALSRSGSRVITGHDDNVVQVRDVETGELVKGIELEARSLELYSRTLELDDESVSAVALSPDGKTAALARMFGGGWAIDVESEERLLRLAAEKTDIYDIEFVDDTTLVTVDREFKMWRHDLKAKTRFEVADAPRVLALRSNGKMLAVDDGTSVLLFDTSSWKVRAEIDAFGTWVRSLAFSPDGRQLAAGMADSTVRVCRVPKGRGSRRR